MFFIWDDEKNDLLKKGRGISFEMIEEAIKDGKLLKIVTHTDQIKYPHQKIMYVDINGYAHCVPFIEGKDEIFLKTIYPSRKINKNFLGELDEET